MKNPSPLLLFLFSFLLTACPPNRQNNLRKLQENNMDFPNYVKETHGNITFLLPEMFEYDYSPGYTLNDNATARYVFNLDVHFGVETYPNKVIESLRFASDAKESNLQIAHKHFIQNRENSLLGAFSSTAKKLPKSYGFDGFVQVVEGKNYTYSNALTYFTATIEVSDHIHVIQLIGKSGNMDYLYDDFLKILKSVH